MTANLKSDQYDGQQISSVPGLNSLALVLWFLTFNHCCDGNIRLRSVDTSSAILDKLSASTLDKLSLSETFYH